MSSAADILLDKNLMPTWLTARQLRDIDAAVRAQSLFSSQTTMERVLGEYQDRLKAALAGQPQQGEATTQFSPDYVREKIKGLLADMGYSPEPDKKGSLEDLSSTARIDLVVKTNTEIAQGQGLWIANQNPVILDEWPAQELFRAEAREVPRKWLERWRLAGDQTGDPIGTGWTITPGEQMIALKNHDIWNWIGSSDLFDDALDVIWPPFAFNSGMWVRDVDRKETEAIGLLEKGEAAPKPMSIGDALKAFTEKLSKLAAEVET
jgi:hypothetical protein